MSPQGQLTDWERDVHSCLLGAGEGVVHLVGIGNPIKQDDGVGLKIVSNLRRLLGPSPTPKIRIHPPSVNPEKVMSEVAAKGERLVVLDAVEGNKEPGSIICARLDQTKFGFFATHNLPLKLVPGIAEAPGETFVIGVQPESLGVGEELSLTVNAASDRLVAAIAGMVGGGG